MRHVVVISTGGTIASRWQGDGYAAEAAGQEVLEAGAVPEDVEVRVVDLFTVNSSRLTTDHQLRLLHAVHDALADPEVDGVVVTHGTDTLEESAFFVDLFHGDRRPVVFTGAQQPLDAADGDAAGNLYDALLTAVSGRDIGAVIVFAGQVFAARGTVKRHTVDARAFGAPDGQPLGRVEFGRVSWARRQPRRAPLPLPERDTAVAARVDIVMHHSDADAVLFDAAVAAGARGIVLVGTGAGNANPEIADAVRRAVASGVKVAVSTRVAAGAVAPLYTGGGAVDLAAAGALLTGTLKPGQARIAVLATLLAVRDAEEADVELRRVLDTAPGPAPASELYLVDGVGH
ncbi:asparaginase [Actinacidiphila bryophytorum]|uniref:asparaginase n=1 Tax=Actinacidiphila bryophytorum TaxID=1436133 RepID=A0A9W4H012_9ACTN|nr:asparaginase [Actinacidiphila bryophytorum]MBM9434498.1 asparaginase [Actinacidiphila bryophytorum]MBN6547168.1 asparaginase [Actinacidiphila bryophytorum]CAG7626741.1 putative L-asparaginase [Actinacidiphila bryophytorum]